MAHNKECCRCKKISSIEDNFTINKKGDFYESCNKCRENKINYRNNNRELIRIRSAEYYKENRELVLERCIEHGKNGALKIKISL